MLTMENVNKAFKNYVDILKRKSTGDHISLDEAIKASEKVNENLVQYMLSEGTLVKKFTGVQITNKEMKKGAMGLVPTISFHTDQGFVGCAHGTPEGEVVCGTQPPIDIHSKEFCDLFSDVAPGQEMYLVSCFPGAKPSKWEVQGRTFHNLGSELRPIWSVMNDGSKEFFVGYATPEMEEFWVANEKEATNILVGAIAAWLSEGYSMEEICEIA